ncbi:prepilin peptidase [Clostridium paridis]|uniref:Prepilin peptidase n=1 Tax=Clostridium paridis TaxID=2803863 RepID=A0A937FHA4_9CLOT|nr:prepilin peptidase [Clostridium paridis]MBL4932267.1 prepilin peptidase [Clostridium paridis]
MAIVVFSIIGVFIFYGALLIVKCNDNSDLEIKREIIVSISILVSVAVLYYKYKLSMSFVFLFYLFIYLIISAYIDYKTMYVYSIFNYITMGVSVIYLIINIKNVSVGYVAISVVIWCCFTTLCSKFKIFGGGDNEILMSISLFIAVKYNYSTLEMLFLNMAICNLILFFTNLDKFNIKEMRFNKNVAYAPSIALSTILLILM